MSTQANFAPRAWTPQQVAQDTTWIHRLSEDAVAGFDAALAHAVQADKPLLSMTQADFPLTAAARSALDKAVAATQGRWGMCLLKGFRSIAGAKPSRVSSSGA